MWWVWRRGLFPRFEVCDADGDVHCTFGARALTGVRPLRDLEGRDLEVVADRDDPTLRVRQRTDHRVIADVGWESVAIGQTRYAFWASRDRTCRATLSDVATDRTLVTARPVKAHSYRPFLRIDILSQVTDPELTAVTLAYWLARDDGGRQPRGGDGGAGGV